MIVIKREMYMKRISYKIFLNGISPTCHSSSLLGLVLNKDYMPLSSCCQQK